jgi:hypothetical protein
MRVRGARTPVVVGARGARVATQPSREPERGSERSRRRSERGAVPRHHGALARSRLRARRTWHHPVRQRRVLSHPWRRARVGARPLVSHHLRSTGSHMHLPVSVNSSRPHDAVRTVVGPTSAARCASHAAGAHVRSWTGRAATSRVTDSGLPRLVTSGTHHTRVSEMRVVAAQSGRHLLDTSWGAPAALVAVTPVTRSDLGPSRHRHDALQRLPNWSG